MKTPPEYTKNLKKKTITEQMLSDCLFSVNKRAKNYRDQAQKHKFDYYGGASQRAEMERYYSYKEQFLSFLEPICIHKQYIGQERRRVYDYDSDYHKMKGRTIVWENCYYNYQEDREVWFYDYETSEAKYLYFLYYELGDRSFHSPVNLGEYKDLPIVPIDDDFTTYGKDIEDLISAQFVIKVLNTLLVGDCELHIKDKIIKIPKSEEEVELIERHTYEKRSPTGAQLNYIDAICEFYGFDNPNPTGFKEASNWLSETLKKYDFAGDKMRAKTKERYLEIFEDHESGLTTKELAEKYQLTPATIRKAIRIAKTY